jgi:type VI secretion system secreted protein VgrG
LWAFATPAILEGINWLFWGSAAAGGAVLATSGDSDQSKANTENLTKCEEKKSCPPCKTMSGRIVPVKTLAYRPLAVIPDTEMQHGVYGSHHNIFEANQAPPNPPRPCNCFWVKQNYVLKPWDITSSMMPMEPFLN